MFQHFLTAKKARKIGKRVRFFDNNFQIRLTFNVSKSNATHADRIGITNCHKARVFEAIDTKNVTKYKIQAIISYTQKNISYILKIHPFYRQS